MEYIRGVTIERTSAEGYDGNGAHYQVWVHKEACQSVMVSDDTDVFMILLSNPCMYCKGILHVISDSVHDLDAAVDALQTMGTCGGSVATLYCLAGCDFSPSIYGMSHDMFWKPFSMFIKSGGSLLAAGERSLDAADLLFCMLYLVRHGKKIVCTQQEQKGVISKEVQRGVLKSQEISFLRRSCFVSSHPVGSAEWSIDVRNFVADMRNMSNELVPHREHIMIHYNRAFFIVEKYWGKSSDRDLGHRVVGGCSKANGFETDGTVLVDCEQDVKEIQKRITNVITSCNCKGGCVTRRCSCVKTSAKCIGCGCLEEICKNRPTSVQTEGGEGDTQGTTETSSGDVRLTTDGQTESTVNVSTHFNEIREDSETSECNESSDSSSEGTHSVMSDELEADGI
ncbi:hypothetical protein BWQ96_08644 [Gracilariopsis chorda]|uniref:Tesmin/TSO1-like CXC domain-containing protein n=1 Tax=Gracilariopsis chorda TaxID=448386 RepID=A0A2V3IHY2_9FLOR|nr:hypothetical protein BWQ96_08644 [Gracilariopsis chorda]|eukprot:PXF41633.1 hypothetical protein BWQ96_08644 [Gracilariopsis chorda]